MFKHCTLALGPPFASLAAKGNLSVALCQKRVLKVKDRVRDLVALDAIDALPAPDGGDFRGQVPPLALGLGCLGEVVQVTVGVLGRQIQRDEFPNESFPVVLHAEFCEEVQFGLEGLRGCLEQLHIGGPIGGIEYWLMVRVCVRVRCWRHCGGGGCCCCACYG